MKRIIWVMVAIVTLLSFAGCGDNEKQKVIIDYVNNGIVGLDELKIQAFESYNSVVGENYTDDYIAYLELTQNTIVMAEELKAEAIRVANEITDKEIQEVHNLYVEFTTEYVGALDFLIYGYENSSLTLIEEGHAKLSAVETLALEYENALISLGEKYGVTIQMK